MTVDCADPQQLAHFWSELLGGAVSEPLPGWRRLAGRGDGPALTFQPVPEAKVGKARLHLDIDVDDVDDAVAEVLRRGGSDLGWRHEYDEGVVVVVADPEGNEFCLVQHYD